MSAKGQEQSLTYINAGAQRALVRIARINLIQKNIDRWAKMQRLLLCSRRG